MCRLFFLKTYSSKMTVATFGKSGILLCVHRVSTTGFISRPGVRKEPCVLVVLTQALEGHGLESRSQFYQLVFKLEQKLNPLSRSPRSFVTCSCMPV